MKNPNFVCQQCGHKWPTSEDDYCPVCGKRAQDPCVIEEGKN